VGCDAGKNREDDDDNGCCTGTRSALKCAAEQSWAYTWEARL